MVLEVKVWKGTDETTPWNDWFNCSLNLPGSWTWTFTAVRGEVCLLTSMKVGWGSSRPRVEQIIDRRCYTTIFAWIILLFYLSWWLVSWLPFLPALCVAALLTKGGAASAGRWWFWEPLSHRRKSSRRCRACRSAVSRWPPLPISLRTPVQNRYTSWVDLFSVMCSNVHWRWFLQPSSTPPPRLYLTTASAPPLLSSCQIIMVHRGTSWRMGYF